MHHARLLLGRWRAISEWPGATTCGWPRECNAAELRSRRRKVPGCFAGATPRGIAARALLNGRTKFARPRAVALPRLATRDAACREQLLQETPRRPGWRILQSRFLCGCFAWRPAGAARRNEPGSTGEF